MGARFSMLCSMRAVGPRATAHWKLSANALTILDPVAQQQLKCTCLDPVAHAHSNCSI